MASGKLGTADIAASTLTTVYTVPSNKTASFSVTFCNRSSGAISIRLAESVTSTPALSEYIVYDRIIEPNGEYERTQRVLDTGKLVVVYVSNVGISVNVVGIEE
jgi:hypothetical protein